MSLKQVFTKILKETKKAFLAIPDLLRQLKLMEVVLSVIMVAIFVFLYFEGRHIPNYGTLTETEVKLKYFELEALGEVFMENMQDPDKVQPFNKISSPWVEIDYFYENPSDELIDQVISNIEEKNIGKNYLQKILGMNLQYKNIAMTNITQGFHNMKNGLQ